MNRSLLIFLLFLGVGGQPALAASKMYLNGIYGMPSFEEYRHLPAEVSARFEQQQPQRFYGSHPEFRKISQRLLEMRHQYSRLIGVGRSLTEVLGYLQGRLAVEAGAPLVSDLPFSVPRAQRGIPLTVAQRQGLRRHLEANGLTPQQIVANAKPLLFFDIVYAGHSVVLLLDEILLWAREEKREQAVRDKVHFLALLPVEMLARQHLRRLYHSMAQDGVLQRFEPDEREIQEAIRNQGLPLRDLIERNASRVFTMPLSTAFYTHVGHYEEWAQRSFTSDLWSQSFDRWQVLHFANHRANAAFLDLYHFMAQGERDAKGCGEALQL